MRNITGAPVVDTDLYGRGYELDRLWEALERGEHVLMLAPRRVGKTSLMLALQRAPRDGWDAVYVDVEDGAGAADCIAAILAELATVDRYRRLLDAVPLSTAVGNIFRNLSGRVEAGPLKLELKGAIGGEWRRIGDRLRARLSKPHAAAGAATVLGRLRARLRGRFEMN